MAPLTDFISRIFSTERTQGLSGGAEVVVDQDPAGAFYVSRLRKHRTDEDLVQNPEYLWATPSYGGRKGGLRAHVHAERGEGVASFTDALVLVNQADWERTLFSAADPWKDRTERALIERFQQYCERERFELLYGTRPLRVWLIPDGGVEMLNQSFNLGPGEFVTGLLPNLYAGPSPRSRAVIAVHLNLPDQWEGYREVGRLYSDQILFTIGRHWLDNFRHPALREPGLYRLQQYPDGSLVHVISPELQDRYLVRSDTVDGGASVLTIAEWNGNPVAYLVLAVLDSATPEVASLAPAPPPSEPEVRAPGARPSPPAATPPATDQQTRGLLAKTIVPGALETRILTLQERGALLQKVHFGSFMDGYDVYLGAGGRVATQMPEPKATIQVRGNRVSMIVQDPTLKVDGRAPGLGKTVLLTGEMVIEVDQNRLLYRDLAGVKADGWPYLGELRRPGAGVYLEFGGAHRIGRDRRCKVRLPDEPHNDNIAWLPSVGGGTTIRSRNGDIPKSRFYTDSIMVASEHAEIDVTQEPVARSLARHCFSYVRRGDRVLSLAPREGAGGAFEVPLENNDEVLVGNCLFQVSFPPPEGLEGPRSGPPQSDIPRPFRPDELAGEVDPQRPGASPFLPPVVEAPPTAQVDRPAPARPRKVGLETMPPPSKPPSPLDAPSVKDIGSGRPPPPMMVGTMSYYAEPPRMLTQDGVEGGMEPVPVFPPPPPSRPEPAPRAAVDAGPVSGAATTEPPPQVETPRRAAAPLRAEAARLPEPPRPGPPRPPPSEPPTDDPVVAVDEDDWKFELSRPARLVLVGWMVSGEAVVGNHRGAAIVVPEARAFPGQPFMTLDYFRLHVRGRKARAELLQPGESRIEIDGQEADHTEALDRARLAIVRRDQNLEPDFDVVLELVDEPSLPEPRARLLRVDFSERLALGLFTLGCPLRDARVVDLGQIRATVRWDGERLAVEDYLDTYRLPAGRYVPFFVREGQKPFRTVPEDGSRLLLAPGDALLAGNALFQFKTS